MVVRSLCQRLNFQHTGTTKSHVFSKVLDTFSEKPFRRILVTVSRRSSHPEIFKKRCSNLKACCNLITNKIIGLSLLTILRAGFSHFKSHECYIKSVHDLNQFISNLLLLTFLYRFFDARGKFRIISNI